MSVVRIDLGEDIQVTVDAVNDDSTVKVIVPQVMIEDVGSVPREGTADLFSTKCKYIYHKNNLFSTKLL